MVFNFHFLLFQGVHCHQSFFTYLSFSIISYLLDYITDLSRLKLCLNLSFYIRDNKNMFPYLNGGLCFHGRYRRWNVVLLWSEKLICSHSCMCPSMYLGHFVNYGPKFVTRSLVSPKVTHNMVCCKVLYIENKLWSVL